MAIRFGRKFSFLRLVKLNSARVILNCTRACKIRWENFSVENSEWNKWNSETWRIFRTALSDVHYGGRSPRQQSPWGKVKKLSYNFSRKCSCRRLRKWIHLHKNLTHSTDKIVLQVFGNCFLAEALFQSERYWIRLLRYSSEVSPTVATSFNVGFLKSLSGTF